MDHSQLWHQKCPIHSQKSTINFVLWTFAPNSGQTPKIAMCQSAIERCGRTMGALACSHDKFLNIILIEGWQLIVQCHERYVNDNLCHANKEQFSMSMLLVSKYWKGCTLYQDGSKSYWSLYHWTFPCQWHAHHQNASRSYQKYQHL